MRLLKIPEAASYVFRRQRLAKLRKSLENGYTLPATGVSPSLSPLFSRMGPSGRTLEHDFAPFPAQGSISTHLWVTLEN